MTAPARPARAGRDWRSVLGSALAAAASCGSLLSLTGLIDSGSWLRAASLAVALLALLTAGLRAATRTPWLPTVAGVVAGAVGVIAVYGGPNPDALPTSAVNPLRGVWVLGRSGIELMESSAAPMPAERSAELLVVIGAIGVFLLVDALALGLDVPALAALPLVAFWSPAVFLGFPTNGWGLFWTGLTYLLLLAVRSAPAAGADWLRHGSAVVAGAALLVVVALVAAPATAALPAWATASLPNFGTGPNGPIQLADNLDLRNSLTGHSSDTAFTYTVAASAPLARKAPSNIPGATPADGATPEPAAAAPTASTVGPLRVFTVDQFDGRQWIRTADPAGSHWQPGQVLGGAPETAYLSGSQAVDVQVTVANLEQFQLPIATFPRTVAITGPWRYDATSDEVIGTQQTAAGQKYTMQVFVPPLTGADLENAAVGTPPGGENYLELPTTAHLVDVQALARQIVGDATTPYAQAMALQSYLRSTANFTYDTTVPAATSDDAVWDFLQDRHGYCVQFATAMAIMARTLNIPTRVAVGFLPGTVVNHGGQVSYVVTGKQAHAWPELYFQGYGWVRFEPTPGQQTGALPTWSNPLAQASVSPTAAPTTDALHQPKAKPTFPSATSTTAAPAGIGTDLARRGQWPPIAAGIVVIALAALAVALALALRRRRRPAELTCEHAWHQLRRGMARHASIRWSDATTPRGAVALVQERLAARTGAGLDGPALDALARLARAVETERYAPRPAAITPAELHHLVTTVRRAAKVSGRTRRGGGPSALPSAP